MKPRRSDAIDWPAGRAAWGQPMFDAIRGALAEMPDRWPTLEHLTALACRRGIVNARGRPLRFVTPDDSSAHYELRIAYDGEVMARCNWHDFFNACQWLTIPRTKARISELHAQVLEAGGDAERRRRSALRDRMTLFDEGGMVVVSPHDSLLDAVRSFRWHELFVERRTETMAGMRFLLLGHAMLENALAPFIGVTAKALLLQAALPSADHEAEWLADIDVQTARWIDRQAILPETDRQRLAPLPFLGVPGWDVRNEDPRFYDNAAYFRPGFARSVHCRGASQPGMG